MNMRSQNLPITFAITFNRPRCAMPIVMSETPSCEARSINWSKQRDDGFVAFD